MFWTIICISLVGSLLSAPLEQKQKKFADSRVVKQDVKKRSAEQIVYGNHQNHNRIATGKKSMLTDGVAPLNTEQLQPDKLDKKATVKVKTESITAKDAEEAATPLEPPVLPPNHNGKDDTAEEIKDLTNMILNSKQANSKEDKSNQNEITSEEANLENLKIEELQNTENEDSSGDEDKVISADKKQGSKGLSLYDYYYPLFTQNRKKRKSSMAALTAEDMDMTANDPRRIKRDLRLSPHDLDLWLRMGKRSADSDIYSDYGDYSPEYQTSDLYDTSSEEVPYIQEVENWPDSSDESLPDDIAKRTLSIPVEPILDPSAEKEQEEIKEELDLLRYLYGNPDGTSVDDDIDYGDSLDTSIEKRSLGQDDNLELEAIFYHGKPGIFIPVPADKATSPMEKRQYMSFVSGSKRSNNDFYPYADETASSGKWGAFVPNAKRLASIDDYQRLYRLASALSGKDSPEESWSEY